MNRIKALWVAGLLMISLVSFSQELYIDTYDWNEDVVTCQAPEEVEKIALLHTQVIEYTFENNEFVEYFLVHYAVKVNSDAEIKNNNVVYISYDEESELVDAKARIIKKDGSIKELDKSKMLDSFDEEEGINYKYFAFEGMEIGDVVEYLYIKKKEPYYNGTRVTIQGKHPVLNYQFHLFAPDFLIFDFHVINDTQSVIYDTLVEDRNHWYLSFDSIPSLLPEESAPYPLLLRQIVYKLDRNINANLKDISSYGKVSQNVFNNIYNTPDKQDKKAIQKIVKNIGIDDNAGLDEQIRQTEIFIKQNFDIVEYSSPDLLNISTIFQNKAASRFGITRLFANILNELGIKHQIVLTSNRSKALFDPAFESYNYLSKYLIYFPETKTFLAPDEYSFRYGLIPAEYTNNYGLFIKQIKIGDMLTGIGKIKFIPLVDYQVSSFNHDVKATLAPDFSQVELDITQSSTGYNAEPLQPYIEHISEDVVQEILDNTLDIYIPGSEKKSSYIENGEAASTGIKPLIMHFTATNSELIDIAGDKYLFKAGVLLGPQKELYSEEERKLPVYEDFKRCYHRTIMIEIPDGYVVKNPEELASRVDYVKDEQVKMLFESKYTYQDGIIKVEVEEYYDQVDVSVEEYPYYRDVINSASDFNKIVLIIEKEE